MSDINSYYDLAQRIEDSFMEIENDITVDFRKNNEEYHALLFQKLWRARVIFPSPQRSTRL